MSGLLRKANDDVRAETRRFGTLLSALMISSLKPSLKNVFASPTLAFWNGNTATLIAAGGAVSHHATAATASNTSRASAAVLRRRQRGIDVRSSTAAPSRETSVVTRVGINASRGSARKRCNNA